MEDSEVRYEDRTAKIVLLVVTRNFSIGKKKQQTHSPCFIIDSTTLVFRGSVEAESGLSPVLGYFSCCSSAKDHGAFFSSLSVGGKEKSVVGHKTPSHVYNIFKLTRYEMKISI